MQSRTGQKRFFAVLLSLSFVAAACGSDAGESTATDAPESTEASNEVEEQEAETDGGETDDGDAMDEESAADDGIITIGFSVQSISRTFFSGMLSGIEGAEAELEEKYGVDIIILTTTAQDESSIQDENTSDLIASGVDGVLFSPVNSGAAVAMVDRLIEANIPVVAVANQIGDVEEFGRNTIYPGTVGYVTNDDIAMGSRAADAADALAADVDGPANIFILQGTNGAANVPLRQDGFTEQLDALGTDYVILDARPGDFSNVISEDTCQNAISAFPEMDIIYSMSDEMTAGCVRALESADRLDIGIASIGGNAKGVQLIEDGLMPATVCQKPGTMGATALDSLLDFIVNGNERGLEFYDTPVVTLDNLDDCIPQW